jgi:hypothetical protein
MDGISHVRAPLGRTLYNIGVAPHIPNTFPSAIFLEGKSASSFHPKIFGGN